ncbi:MAG: CinA family protein [Rhodospirillaceae bacterium]|nr:CinA family protein [Rhodospirillaceae bacterium]MYB12750.1 CinA family protein [Rhodospirillaceae bacterium]MYI49489.1 CinA family protein [Rhodospirillaceae bacterium]
MDALLAPARDCAAILKEHGWTVAVSESSSGGLVSAALLAVPGASAYFRGGGVIYTRDARRELLQLADADVRVRGATEDYALIAAAQIRRQLETTFAVAESGAAGPSDSPYGPAAGTTCLAVSGPVDLTRTVETGHNDRPENMRAFARAALDLLLEAMTAEARRRIEAERTAPGAP